MPDDHQMSGGLREEIPDLGQQELQHDQYGCEPMQSNGEAVVTGRRAWMTAEGAVSLDSILALCSRAEQVADTGGGRHRQHAPKGHPHGRLEHRRPARFGANGTQPGQKQ